MTSRPLDDAIPINESEAKGNSTIIVSRKRKYLAKSRSLLIHQSNTVTLFLLLLCCWAIGYALFGEVVGIHSQMFSLVVLFITAKIAGYLTSLLKLPPMVGMLLMGVLLRNVGFLNIDGNYRKFTAVLRQLALVNIMLPAGLGLDSAALKKMIWMILNLAIVPVAAEVVGIAVASYFLLGFPWLWGILLGLLLAAVSPAVIIPCLFELQDMGYGVNKGIHTLVIAASTINDIICIALFGIMIGLIFSSGSLTMQILQGPIVIAMGFAYGIVWGIVCQILPNLRDNYLITLRTLLLGLGCVVAALGSDALGYGGAGPLGCIVAAFVASLGWRKQGWGTSNPVRMNFALLWKFFEPISFGLIGMEVNLQILEPTTVGWAMIIMLVPLLAALGPVALDKARELNDDTLIDYASVVVVVAVLSIIVTSPIGAVLIMQLGPKFLHRTIPDNSNL
ncbi:sodium/hydrogen exchanger family [Holotrichia oblita]|uniref:Sodium/hydrogen exchanger family n=1 Tax=Holotrichia oblita TaxID=644536 RepID=A0ACB9TJX3_HOLOL|nr:sodium/hydrogen exchanger family [Holotrichia oblita]